METLDRVHYRISFRRMVEVTVILPLVSLLLCFVSAMIFQRKEVNTTICDVYNFIPSISAITGISPQRYIWRIGVALHCTPRLLIASVYYRYYSSLAINLDQKDHSRFRKWVDINYWLNLVENLSLIGVTYISNKENYPIHEKLFIIFMTSSLSYMLLNCIVFRWGNPQMDPLVKKSYVTKLALLSGKLIFTAGLLYYFYRHRRFCDELAFSYFSFCEYCMAVANMAYHVTVVWDCPDECILVGSSPVGRLPSSSSSDPTTINNPFTNAPVDSANNTLSTKNFIGNTSSSQTHTKDD